MHFVVIEINAVETSFAPSRFEEIRALNPPVAGEESAGVLKFVAAVAGAWMNMEKLGQEIHKPCFVSRHGTLNFYPLELGQLSLILVIEKRISCRLGSFRLM